MDWQHTYPQRIAERQLALAQEAEAQRLSRSLPPATPRYREWLARRLLLLALRLAPSLRWSLHTVVPDDATPLPSARW